MTTPRASLSAALALSMVAPPVLAQIRASEPASVSQTVDGTRITVEYSRPRVRARDSIFGKVVTWGEVWTPGANWATTLDLGRDARIEDRPVAKGKYSVWIVVRKEGPWTMVLDPRHKRYHSEHPDSSAQQIRFPVRKSAGPFTEDLTWSFSRITSTGATLALNWGAVMIPFDIRVTPTYSVTFEEARSAPFLGRYTFQFMGGPPGAAKPLDFTVSYANGSLMGRWDPSPWGPEFASFILIAIEKVWFVPGFLQNGEIYDVERDMVFEFTMKAGKAEGFEVRGPDDKVFAKGERKG